MKSLLQRALVLGSLLGTVGMFSACDSNSCEDVVCPTGQYCDNGECLDLPNSGNLVVNTNIAENTLWTKDNVYQLGGRITVLDGATLTIEAGTIIKGEAGSGANATALLVARGGKLIAEGRPDAPIIFTSVADEITPEQVASGDYASPNLDPTLNGLWGGVLILGRAPISASGDEIAIEGIPTTDANGLYGGTSATDDSGILKYVSIRHGGTNIGAGNEINGLTLGGVGSTTIIENIEIVSNQDDGIEWFGGTVSAKNVVVWNTGDDALDTDQSWGGTVENFVILYPAGHCFELDGPEGTMVDGHTIRNGVVYASNEDRVSEDLINTDDNSVVDLENILITGIAEGQKVNRVEHTEGEVTFTGIQLDVDPANLADYFPDGATIPAGFSAGSTVPATVDLSVFDWTWAKQAGAF
jgi:hypothetical protein